MPHWNIEGQYMETCNCALVCPCIWSNMTERPTEGDCKAAVAMRIDRGQKDGVALDGLSFIVMLQSPGPMADGNLTVGLIVDDRASDAQAQAIADIATGGAGGPMATLAPLVGRIAGMQRAPIRFESDGLRHAVRAGELVDQECAGIESPVAPGEAIAIVNSAHPVNQRVSLARATRSRFHVFGMDWDDSTGQRNGHFAPFSWSA